MKINQGKLGSSPSSISAKVTTRAGAFKNSGKIGDLGNKGGSPANTRLGAGGGAIPTVKFQGRIGAVRGNSGAINRGGSSIKSGGRVGGGGLGKKGRSYGKSRNSQRRKRAPNEKIIKEGVTLSGHARLVVTQGFDFKGQPINFPPSIWEAEINGRRWEGEDWGIEISFVHGWGGGNESFTYPDGSSEGVETTETKFTRFSYSAENPMEDAAWAMDSPYGGQVIYTKKVPSSRFIGGSEDKINIDPARPGRSYHVQGFKLSR